LLEKPVKLSKAALESVADLTFSMVKSINNCRVPDEWLLGGRHAILVGREVLRGLLADLNSRGTTC